MTAKSEKYPVPPEIKAVFDKALQLRKRNKQKRARRVLLGLLELFPEDPRILNLLGTTYLDEENGLVEAERYFLLSLKYAPDFADALCNISGVYSRTERYEKSVEYARRAIKADTKEAAPWMTLGLYYARKGEVKTALDYFKAAYSRDSEYSLAAYNAACALAELARNEEALQYLEKSLTLLRNLEAAKSDPNLDSLREYPEFDRIIAEAEVRLDGRAIAFSFV
ncbi:MAG: hypothetical protein GY771_06695 [bacterium]|nr:hypothetical protein [bacterium]